MLSEDEKKFITYWENVREEHSRFFSKLTRGLPMALLFGLPVFLSIAAVYFFSPEWYTKISQKADSSSVAIVAGVLISVIFFSYVRMHFKWEMNEQLYRELKAKS